mmetsp:Transcript_18329/g.27268  ORF Transcript_18329/g.27268 Transcript_18329/m.27268 type:complete len:237 (-) Transcript_18329:1148-1858(-)
MSYSASVVEISDSIFSENAFSSCLRVATASVNCARSVSTFCCKRPICSSSLVSSSCSATLARNAAVFPSRSSSNCCFTSTKFCSISALAFCASASACSCLTTLFCCVSNLFCNPRTCNCKSLRSFCILRWVISSGVACEICAFNVPFSPRNVSTCSCNSSKLAAFCSSERCREALVSSNCSRSSSTRSSSSRTCWADCPQDTSSARLDFSTSASARSFFSHAALALDSWVRRLFNS